MGYSVLFHRLFVPEWKALPLKVKERIGEVLDHLEDDGPLLGRPDVDRLNGSAYANMKEMRVRVSGQVWRVAFAFDPQQRAVVLCAGDKQGISQALFYRRLIDVADARFGQWLREMTG